jgi:hypothetical protein
VLEAAASGARAVAADPAYAEACLEPPTLWGVVNANAETLTVRTTIKTTMADRDRIERAVLEHSVRELKSGGVLTPSVAPGESTADVHPPESDT